jgi:hypothetical protein
MNLGATQVLLAQIFHKRLFDITIELIIDSDVFAGQLRVYYVHEDLGAADLKCLASEESFVLFML